MSDAIEAACRGYLLELDIDPDYPHALKPGAPAWWETEVPAIRAAITAYEAAKGGGVGVKPLKWYHPLDNTKLQRADTIVGTYRVWTHSEANGLWFWALSDGYERAKGDVKSEADGLAAAETDHLSRIRSALTSPASGERDAVIEDGFIGDDFAEVYRILRDEGTTHAALTAALSNNLNVIIAALARASAGGSA